MLPLTVNDVNKALEYPSEEYALLSYALFKLVALILDCDNNVVLLKFHVKLVGPSGPIEPVEPVSPVAPVAPIGPVAPVAPIGPDGPVLPNSPIGP